MHRVDAGMTAFNCRRAIGWRGSALVGLALLGFACAADDPPPLLGNGQRPDDVSVTDMEIPVDGMSQIFVGDGYNSVTRQVYRPSCLTGDRTQMNVRRLTAQ